MYRLLTKSQILRIICMDMPPLTSPDKPLNPLFWRILLVLACVLVFSFALHAKTAVYGHASPQPSTSSKLWMSDAQWQPSTVVPSSTLMWLAAFLSYLGCWHNVRRNDAAPVVVAREQWRQQYLNRFLRPPPPQ